MVLIVAIFWGMAGDEAGKIGRYLILKCLWVSGPVRQRGLLWEPDDCSLIPVAHARVAGEN